MKLLYTLSAALFTLFNCTSVSAQSFTEINDTIHISATPSLHNYYDSIVIGTSPVTFSWDIIYCNFPASWMDNAAFCDNAFCRTLNTLSSSGSIDTSESYNPSDTGALRLTLDLPVGAPSGCYYVTARLHNIAAYSDSATETWNVCSATTDVQVINTASISLTTSPNPTHTTFTLNLKSTQNEEATIIITNMLGEKVKQLTATTNTDTQIQLDSPAGIYFISAITKEGSVNEKIEIH